VVFVVISVVAFDAGVFGSTLALFASVTLVSYGVLPQRDLAAAAQPSMGVVLESVVSEWGDTFISIGVVISVLGACLAWTLLNAEVLLMPARTDVMPRVLGRASHNGTPIAALVTTNLSVQAFLLLVLVVDDALDFMLKLDTALTLVPYLLAAAYAGKLAVTRETYAEADEPERRTQLVVAALAVAYSVYLLYAAGPEFLLLGCLIYAPGTVLYVVARREHGSRIFHPAEAAACALLWALAVVAVVLSGRGTFDLSYHRMDNWIIGRAQRFRATSKRPFLSSRAVV
jgi:arginine:ornithine antiporter/lysine permease